MTWEKPAPDMLELWKARLNESDVLKKLFHGAKFALHYPDVDVTTDPLPCAALFEEIFTVEKVAPGEVDDAPGNSVSAVFYFDPVRHKVGRVEQGMSELCRELCEWETEGLSIIKATKTRATKVAASVEAGSNDAGGKSYRTIAIVAWYS